MVGFITSLRFPVMGVNYMTNYVIAIDQQKNDCFGTFIKNKMIALVCIGLGQSVIKKKKGKRLGQSCENILKFM